MTAAALDKKQVRQHFSQHARDYNRYARVQQKVATNLADRLLTYRQPWQRALEVGCGTGMLSERVLQHFPKLPLILSDLAHGMCGHVREYLPAFPVSGADAAALPFREGSFDLLLSSSVYQWLNDLPNAFAELHRVARPGAVAAIALFGSRTLYELRSAHQQALNDKQSHSQIFPCQQQVMAALDNRFEILELSSELEVEWHPGVRELLLSLKKIGAQNANQERPPGLASRRVIEQMISYYQQQFGTEQGIPATYEVIYLLAKRKC